MLNKSLYLTPITPSLVEHTQSTRRPNVIVFEFWLRSSNTLASFSHIKQYYLRPLYHSKHDKSYIEPLDDIALVLVKDPGDVVAVSMEIFSPKLVFFYAKNGPCDASVTTYLDKVVNVIRENEPEAVACAMLPVLLTECAAKFVARIGKCQGSRGMWRHFRRRTRLGSKEPLSWWTDRYVWKNSPWLL